MRKRKLPVKRLNHQLLSRVPLKNMKNMKKRNRVVTRVTNKRINNKINKITMVTKINKITMVTNKNRGIIIYFYGIR